MTTPFQPPQENDTWWRIESSTPLTVPAGANADTPVLRLRVESGWQPPILLNAPKRVTTSPATLQAWVNQEMTDLYNAAHLTGTVTLTSAQAAAPAELPAPVSERDRIMISGPPGKRVLS